MPLPPSDQDRLAIENLPLLEVAALRLGVSSSDARRADLFSAGQEALIFASRRFEPARATFRTYASRRVFGSMLNVLAAHSERADILARLSNADPGIVEEIGVGPNPERRTLTSEVLAAIEKLPSLSRDLIKDHYFEERPLASVGARHGLSKTRASVHLSRALGQLREALEDQYSAWPTQAKATKRRFSERDKAKVLRHARRPGTSLSELARKFDIPRTTIITWRKTSTRGDA